MTGIGSGKVLKLNLEEAANIVNKANEEYAKKIGINPAARTTCTKPEGSVSCLVGSSSGIHAWHNDYYIRRMRVGKNEALYHYLKKEIPELIEDCVFKPHLEAIISIPQKAPEGSILRIEKPLDMLERVKKFNLEWVHKGHHSGANKNNVSCTVSLKTGEWESVGQWMWDNKDSYTGISVLPFDNGSYIQAPFTDCTKEEYENLMKHCKNIDLSKIVEVEDLTTLIAEAACSGNSCEVTTL